VWTLLCKEATNLSGLIHRTVIDDDDLVGSGVLLEILDCSLNNVRQVRCFVVSR
jgi:hypothetical protein